MKCLSVVDGDRASRDSPEFSRGRDCQVIARLGSANDDCLADGSRASHGSGQIGKDADVNVASVVDIARFAPVRGEGRDEGEQAYGADGYDVALHNMVPPSN